MQIFSNSTNTRPITAKAQSTQPASTLTEVPPTCLLHASIESSHMTIRDRGRRRHQGCSKTSSLWLHVAAHEEGRPVVYVRGGSGHVLRRRLLLPHLREHGWRSPASSTHCYKCFCHAQRGEGDDGDEEKDEEGPELDSSGDEIQMPVKRRRP